MSGVNEWELTRRGRVKHWIREHIGFDIINPATVTLWAFGVVIIVGELTGLAPNTFFDTMLFCGGWGAAYAAWRTKRQSRAEQTNTKLWSGSFDHAEGGARPDPIFCHDCGRRYVPWTNQQGFNATTGEPVIKTKMACPGWTATYANAQMQIYSGSSFGAFGIGTSITSCGNTVTTNAVPQTHTDHPTGDVRGDCPGCIEDMVSNGIITRADAEKMRAAP